MDSDRGETIRSKDVGDVDIEGGAGTTPAYQQGHAQPGSFEPNQEPVDVDGA